MRNKKAVVEDYSVECPFVVPCGPGDIEALFVHTNLVPIENLIRKMICKMGILWDIIFRTVLQNLFGGRLVRSHVDHRECAACHDEAHLDG